MKLKIFLLVLVLLPLVEASGLTIVNNQIFSLNKTTGLDKQLTFQLKNEEAFDFYNITFDNNVYAMMPIINVIHSGETINVTIVIITNDNFDGVIKIKGFYQANIGISNKQYNLTVDYDNGISECDKTLIKGDSIKWQNNVNDEIKMKNENTGEYITTIPDNETYIKLFDSPIILSYSFYRYGFRFTDICDIIVLNDEGLINNPQYDANLHLNITNSYMPTNIQVTVFENNYSLNFYDETDGVITIKNIGSNIAKNIVLTGEWLFFSKNNFDLEIGETKAVTYTIDPYITQSSETDKTYVKNITINGNFNRYEIPLTIFIKYADIDVIGNFTDNFITPQQYLQFCNANPDSQWCKIETKIVYKNINGSNEEFNVTYSEEQVRDIYRFLFDYVDSDKVIQNQLKDNFDNITMIQDYLLGIVLDLNNTLSLEIKSRENEGSVSIFFVIFLFIILIIGLLSYIAIMFYKSKKTKDFKRWTTKMN